MIRVEPEREVYPPAPTRGEHTSALLAELGYERETIDELYRTGAFGDDIDTSFMHPTTTNRGAP